MNKICKYTVFLLFLSLSGLAQDINQIYSTTEISPSFVANDDSLRNYIRHHLKYPKKLINENLNYSAIIKFIVEKDGTLTNLMFIKHTKKEVENEIQKLIDEMPKWIPAKEKGLTVRCYYVMPIKLCPDSCLSW